MTYDPKRAWNIAATEITFPDNDGYFLYIKVPTAAGETASEFIVDKGYVVPSRDAGYFICPWGYIHPPVGGLREYSPYWGNRRGAAAAYVYIAYASASDGTGFTMTFNAALDYIAIKDTTAPIASPAASDFAGLWKNYKGASPAKATGAEITAGTDDTKYATPKSIKDSNVLQSSTSEVKNVIPITAAAHQALIDTGTTDPKTLYLRIG